MAGTQEAVEFEHDPEFLDWVVPLMEKYGRYFDSEVRGVEHFPNAGPVLLVGNHSGPNCDPDTPALMAAWYRKNGVQSPLVVLSFDFIFGLAPIVSDFFRRLAQVPANHRNAEAALDRGAAVLVYPGGLEDIARPWTERNRIELAGHKGFIKLALRKGVTVIPVVSHGGHESSIVLSRGRFIAKALGLQKFRTSVMPLIWTIPWGLVLGPIPSWPIPTKVTLQVCEPMDWAHLSAEDAENPDVVDRCYREIAARMQDTLDDLAREIPHPILTRLQGYLRKRSSRTEAVRL
ncbi:MAG: 1-acyl-sn-glycerol-3-phosphate acyltransferase [Polyangiales bacterium]